jgi:predicted Ser/Thr protein kinase
MYVLEQRIAREDYPEETKRKYLEFIKGWLSPRYAEFIGKEIQTAYLESYSEYGQNIFDRYVTYADCWIQDEEFRDPIPVRSSTGRHSIPNWKRSKSRLESPTRKISATRS